MLDLVKIRQIMKENMTVSGTHDNEPWNFVECAMTKVQGFTKIAVYYFYKRCEVCDEIESVFQPFLEPAFAGAQPPLLAAMTMTRTMVEASVLLLLALVYERRNI
jgi:hypothetical protein